MQIPWEYYKVFYHVARLESLTRAAEALCSSQPNVTRTMNHLEESLGCRLMVRTHHGVRLTTEGIQL